MRHLGVCPKSRAECVRYSPGVTKALVGDHWTYEVKDEISGAIKFTRTDMVTDISNNEIAVRVDFADPGRTSNIIYDRSWNILRSDPFKYSPNDGTGVQLPLTTGSQWKFAIDVVNSRNGLTFRRVGNSRVTGQESITTKAGSFNTSLSKQTTPARMCRIQPSSIRRRPALGSPPTSIIGSNATS